MINYSVGSFQVTSFMFQTKAVQAYFQCTGIVAH